jgi:serine/threonine protein phosphatase 1
MAYITSDPHGELDLLKKLLRAINFSENDEMIVCGDVLDKGSDGFALAHFIMNTPNISCIMGNHEDSFWTYVKRLDTKRWSKVI